jgi:hypothetical protein
MALTNLMPATPAPEEATREFLREMTELARKHRMGIVGPIDIFTMEDDDWEREYREDGRGKWEFF